MMVNYGAIMCEWPHLLSLRHSIARNCISRFIVLAFCRRNNCYIDYALPSLCFVLVTFDWLDIVILNRIDIDSGRVYLILITSDLFRQAFEIDVGIVVLTDIRRIYNVMNGKKINVLQNIKFSWNISICFLMGQ